MTPEVLPRLGISQRRGSGLAVFAALATYTNLTVLVVV